MTAGRVRGRAALARIDAYYRASLRVRARTERVGPFILFVATGVDHFACARPAPATGSFTAADIASVMRRQWELGEPGMLDWVCQATPALGTAVRDAALASTEYPLLCLHQPRPASVLAGPRAMVLSADDPVAVQACALINNLASPPGCPPPVRVEWVRLRRLTLAAVLDRRGQPVAAGGHVPEGSMTELTRIGVRPGGRADAVATALTWHAVTTDVTPFVVARDPRTAKVFRRIGYRPIGAVCTARTALPATGTTSPTVSPL